MFSWGSLNGFWINREKFYFVNLNIRAINLFFTVERFRTKRIWSKWTFTFHRFAFFHQFNLYLIFSIVRVWHVFWYFENLIFNLSHWIGVKVSRLRPNFSVFGSISLRIKLWIILFNILVRSWWPNVKESFTKILFLKPGKS